MNERTCTLQVVDIKDSDKTGATCPLKGEMTINGTMVKVAMTLSADGRDVFEKLDITHIDDLIDIEFKESSQQTL